VVATTPARAQRLLLVTFGSLAEPHGGLQVRSRVLLETLSGLGVDVAVASTREPVGAGAALPWASRVVAPSRKPFRGFSLDWARVIREAARSADALIVANAMLVPAVYVARTGKPVVWDTNECQSLHYRRLAPTPRNRLMLLVWTLLERLAARRCAVAVSIGDVEAEAWRRLHPRLRGKLATVDHAPLARAVDQVAARAALVARIGVEPQRVLLFLGTMTAKHNAAAARWLLRELAPRLPVGTALVMCGPGSEQLSVDAALHDTVFCLGAVADVDSVVAAADLCLAPLASGAGVKTKVLHYLWHGRPVAGTPVAFEGLSGAPGLHVASLDQLCGLVLHLLDAPPPARAPAREWVEQHHGRERVREQWRHVLQWIPRP
jgi:hypothetical protein